MVDDPCVPVQMDKVDEEQTERAMSVSELLRDVNKMDVVTLRVFSLCRLCRRKVITQLIGNTPLNNSFIFEQLYLEVTGYIYSVQLLSDVAWFRLEFDGPGQLEPGP